MAALLKAAYIVVSEMRVGWRERISVFAPNRTLESRQDFICFCLRVSHWLDLIYIASILHLSASHGPYAWASQDAGLPKILREPTKDERRVSMSPWDFDKGSFNYARSNFTSSTFPASDVLSSIYVFKQSQPIQRPWEKINVHRRHFSWQVHKWRNSRRRENYWVSSESYQVTGQLQ